MQTLGSEVRLIDLMLIAVVLIIQVVTELVFTHPIEKMILSMGVIAYHDTLAQPQSFYLLVYLDGKVIGWVSDNGVQELVDSLRHCKIHSLVCVISVSVVFEL